MPANNTAATAIDIGTLSGYTAYTIDQDAWNGAGVDDLWYSYLPVAGDDMLEVYAYGNGTTVLPALTIRSGPPPAATPLDNSHSSTSRPVQQDIVTFVSPGERVYFKIVSSNVNPSVVHLRIARGQKEELIRGDLYINDSSPGYPGIAMSAADAIPKRYSLNYPAGEGQQVLTNGIVAVINAFDTPKGPRIYDVDAEGFTLRATPTMPDQNYIDGLSTNQIDTFWSTKKFGVANSFAVSFDADGVVGTPLDLGSANFTDVVPQADNSAVYGVNGTTIQKITNPGAVVTSFVTVDAGFSFACNLLMMTDDTLLVPYEKAATTNYVKQFSLAGSLLSTTTLTGVTGTVLERVFADIDDPDFFWTWRQTSTLNFFEKWPVGGSAAVVSVSRMKFIESVSQTTTLAADTVYSGADFSCVPIVLRVSNVPTTNFTIRRLRRFLLPSSPDNKTMQIPTLELLMRTGIGLTPGDPNDPPVLGSDPQVMMRISKDGGKTWGAERWISAGALGQYKGRVRWTRATGNYRNAVCEIVVSDPVDWQMLAMLGEPLEGTS